MSRYEDRLREALIALIPNLRAFAISISRDIHRADDLVQETLLRAWDYRATFKEGTNLKAWLFTILRNAYFNENRKLERQFAHGEHADHPQLVIEAPQDLYLEFKAMLKGLTELSPEHREVLILVAAEGLSYEEAAVICGCAVGTVKSRLSRARERLKEIMNAPGSAARGETQPCL